MRRESGSAIVSRCPLFPLPALFPHLSFRNRFPLVGHEVVSDTVARCLCHLRRCLADSLHRLRPVVIIFARAHVRTLARIAEYCVYAVHTVHRSPLLSSPLLSSCLPFAALSDAVRGQCDAIGQSTTLIDADETVSRWH